MLPSRRVSPIFHPFFRLWEQFIQQIPGGADTVTTASVIETFFLAMVRVRYPKVQKEAQAKLDKVLNGRLPEHGDFPSLPYLSAVVKEVYRYANLLQVFTAQLTVFLDGSL